jgi:hypothetical protein
VGVETSTHLGDEIIASKFFRAMLEHDGLPVPEWDQEEVDAVRKDLNAVPWKPQREKGRTPNEAPCVVKAAECSSWPERSLFAICVSLFGRY